MSVSSVRNIAIIGAGPAGLVATKKAYEYGLNPTTFEKGDAIGGLWRHKSGSTWDNMKTNISHHTCMFSDLSFEKPCDDFPNQKQVFEYLKKYVEVYRLDPFLRLKTEVINVSKTNDGWEVEWTEDNQTKKEIFEYVIVASGFFSKATQPNLPGSDSFKGQVLHSQSYKNPEPFKNKTVAVIGNSYSGCEIASELVGTAKEVINVAKEAVYVLPRYIKKGEKMIPINHIFHSRAAHMRSMNKSIEENNRSKHEWLSTISNQEALPDKLKVTTDPKHPAYAVISDQYVDDVKSNKIDLQKVSIDRLEENKIVFKDGTSKEIDAIICCTGYQTQLPFFGQEILKELEYDADDTLQPLLLHKTVFPRNLPNMAFVGLYRGPYFGVMELQAQWASFVFAEKRPLPTQQEIDLGIAEERRIREMRPRPQFPHPDYVGLCEDLARQCNVAPDLEKIKEKDPLLHKQLLEGPFTVVSYRQTNGNYSKWARTTIHDLNLKYGLQ
jgi:dimethylaniline monooxygenase (N-oxide forming)